MILADSHCFDLPVGLSEDYFNNHGQKQQTTFHQANSKEFVLLYFSDKIFGTKKLKIRENLKTASSNS